MTVHPDGVGVSEDGDKVAGAGDGAVRGVGAGGSRGVPVSGHCKHAVGVCEDGDGHCKHAVGVSQNAEAAGGLFSWLLVGGCELC